ncbi:Superoxide dismutase [Cu-Zn] [Orchesella cincta]|uniref:Superoxide dismutase [Cu-Zn] n=1 Tax=Orchesella cincta TaxID=48709 RepID=A0A1D2NID4_ORCCI|nr:Superoxide dismutase [Cu-Zn] [Orchesella cincta]
MAQIKFILLLAVLAIVGTSTSSALRRSRRMRRNENGNSRPLIKNADRSVYARRNFALPDVVSDVYEVYVGPTDHRDNPAREAVAVISGKEPGVQGVISFIQVHPNEPVYVNGTISGLSPGKHGFHVHQKGVLTDGCTSTAGHFNPYMQPHGAPMDRFRHIGDLGNINAEPNGIARVMIYDSLISLSGVNSIVGRAVVVHSMEDDLGLGMHQDSKTTGNAGGRVGCGVIGLAS